MLKQLKIELSRAFKNNKILFVLIIGCMITMYQFISTVVPSAVNVGDENARFPLSVFKMWIGGEHLTYFSLMYYMIVPLLAAIPFADSFYADKKSGYIKNIFVRTKKINYFSSKYLAVFISAGVVGCIPLILNLLSSAMIIPSIIPDPASATFPIVNKSIMSELFYSDPYLYTAIYLGIDFVFFGLFATIALTTAHFIRNRISVLLSPFICYVLIYFLADNTDNYRYNPNSFLRPSQPVIPSVAGLLIMGIVIFMLTFGIFVYKGLKDDTY